MMMHHLSLDIVSVRYISDWYPSFSRKKYCRVLIDYLSCRLLHTSAKFEAADIAKLASILLEIVLQVCLNPSSPCIPL